MDRADQGSGVDGAHSAYSLHHHPPAVKPWRGGLSCCFLTCLRIEKCGGISFYRMIAESSETSKTNTKITEMWDVARLRQSTSV